MEEHRGRHEARSPRVNGGFSDYESVPSDEENNNARRISPQQAQRYAARVRRFVAAAGGEGEFEGPRRVKPEMPEVDVDPPRERPEVGQRRREEGANRPMGRVERGRLERRERLSDLGKRGTALVLLMVRLAMPGGTSGGEEDDAAVAAAAAMAASSGVKIEAPAPEMSVASADELILRDGTIIHDENTPGGETIVVSPSSVEAAAETTGEGSGAIDIDDGSPVEFAVADETTPAESSDVVSAEKADEPGQQEEERAAEEERVIEYTRAYSKEGEEILFEHYEMTEDLRGTERTYYDHEEEKERPDALGVELEGGTLAEELERLQRVIASQPEIAADYATALGLESFDSDEAQYEYAKKLAGMEFSEYKEEVQPVIDELNARLSGSTIEERTGYVLRTNGKETDRGNREYMTYGRIDSSRNLRFIRIVRGGKNVLGTTTGRHKANKQKSARAYSEGGYGDPGICISTGGEIWYREGSVPAKVTEAPTEAPTNTPKPTEAPTNTPKPTEVPTEAPTNTPKPTEVPTEAPTNTPKPTEAPTNTPKPTEVPTEKPTEKPKSEEGEIAGAEAGEGQGQVTKTEQTGDVTGEPVIGERPQETGGGQQTGGQSQPSETTPPVTPPSGSEFTPEELEQMEKDNV